MITDAQRETARQLIAAVFIAERHNATIGALTETIATALAAEAEKQQSHILNLESALRGEQGIEFPDGTVVNVALLHHELEQARQETANALAELGSIRELCARRAALDDEPTLYAKVAKAISHAKRAEEAERVSEGLRLTQQVIEDNDE